MEVDFDMHEVESDNLENKNFAWMFGPKLGSGEPHGV